MNHLSMLSEVYIPLLIFHQQPFLSSLFQRLLVNHSITFQISYLQIHYDQQTTDKSMQQHLHSYRHKLRVSGLVLYFLIVPSFLAIFIFLGLSGLSVLKLEDVIQSGETNSTSTHGYIELYVTKTCSHVDGPSVSTKGNVLCFL